MEYMKTPLGRLIVDTEVTTELKKTGDFTYMDNTTDESERFIEMQLPFISKLMDDRKGLFKVVPILVGTLSYDQIPVLARRFQPYLKDKANVFVFSSSLCHWGEIYGYTTKLPEAKTVLDSIKLVDQLAILSMNQLRFKPFDDFLMDTKAKVFDNQIIGLFLYVVRQYLNSDMYGLLQLDEEKAALAEKVTASFKLTGQAWSFPDVTLADSCISFFSAVVTFGSEKYIPEEPKEPNPLDKAS